MAGGGGGSVVGYETHSSEFTCSIPGPCAKDVICNNVRQVIHTPVPLSPNNTGEKNSEGDVKLSQMYREVPRTL